MRGAKFREDTIKSTLEACRGLGERGREVILERVKISLVRTRGPRTGESGVPSDNPKRLRVLRGEMDETCKAGRDEWESTKQPVAY